jgi:peptidoglycan/xylan/chitin deacetylase (PgdA/CDA1 family)
VSSTHPEAVGSADPIGTRPGRPSRRTVLGLAGVSAGYLAGCSRDVRQNEATALSSSSSRTAASGPSPAAASTVRSTPTASPAAGPDITHGPRTADAVALTFHGDGPESIVRETIAVLRKARAQVTVLAIGRWLAANPDLAARIQDAGHELGNHTWSHRTMPRLDTATIRAEVDRAAAELHQVTGGTGRWFRPSGTPSSTPAIRAAAVSAGYGACLGYDVDPLDYTDPGPEAIVRALARSVRPGSIVSLHLGHPGTLAALPAVLAHLSDRGLPAVTASRLLKG